MHKVSKVSAQPKPKKDSSMFKLPLTHPSSSAGTNYKK